MTIQQLLLVAGLSAAALSAQNPLSSPDGYLSNEGGQYGWLLGEHSEARMMFFDGEMRGRVAVIKETAYRHDDYRHTARSCMGRSWSSVSLKISPCDYSKLDANTFDNNPSSTPSLVFSASVTWPTVAGYPKTSPASWDIRFPFGQSYIHTGATDICLDYDFNGGQLANNGKFTWDWYQTYRLDSYNGGDEVQGTFRHLGTGCFDSSQTTYAAYCWIYTYLYSQNYTTNPAWANHYRIRTSSRNTAAGKPVIHCISGFGNTAGQTWPGVGCEKLYVDTTQPFFFAAMAANSGSSATFYDWGTVPYNAAFEGVPLFVQGAWDDSVTGEFKLTYGEVGNLPKYPKDYKRASVYQKDPSKKATSTDGTLYLSANYNNIIRYGT